MAHRYRILKAEVDADPINRDYASMTDQEVTADINSNLRTAPDKVSITAAELFEATVQAEYANLGPGAKAEYDQILSLGAINVADGAKARTDMEAMFSGGTLTAIQALYSGQQFYRWQEIGLSQQVRVGHVEDVRR